MPAVSHTATLQAPLEQVWTFVRSFDNWARYIDGYQNHEVVDDTHSTWSIKGTAGSVTRTVTFDVEITEWDEGDHVAFTLAGRSEPLTGTGRFLTRATGARSAPAQSAAPPALERRKGPLARFLDRLGRWLHRRTLQRDTDVAPNGPAPAGSGGSGAPGTGPSTDLTFDIDVTAGGMMAPMINPMMVPMLTPVAENLANRLIDAIAQRISDTQVHHDA